MSINQEDYSTLENNFKYLVAEYKTARIVKSVSIPYQRRMTEVFAVLVGVDEQILEREVTDIVVFIYKIYKCMHDGNRRLALYWIWRRAQQVKIQKQIDSILELYQHRKQKLIGSIQDHTNLGFTEEAITQKCLFKALKRLRQCNIGQHSEEADHLKRALLKRLVRRIERKTQMGLLEIRCIVRGQSQIDIHRVWENKMMTLAKRYLTKLYVNNSQKEPLQEKYEALGKMICYLNKAKRQENLKREVLNRYVTSRYLDLSKAFFQIQQPYPVLHETLLDLKDEFNQTLSAHDQQRTLLGFKKLRSVVIIQSRNVFRKIKTKALVKNSIVSTQKVQKPKENVTKPVDAPIFGNCLNQYLYILGNITTEREIMKRKGITILKILLQKNRMHESMVLRRYFYRFVEATPAFNFSVRLSIVKNLQELQRQKEDLINRLTE